MQADAPFRHAPDPVNMKDEMQEHQPNQNQREDQVQITPIVTMKTPEVLLRLRHATPTDEESHQYSYERHAHQAYHQQSINDRIPTALFHGTLH